LQDIERFKGSVVPLITPFDESGEFDERTFRKLVDFQIENGSHGISVEGTTGEPSALSLEEKSSNSCRNRNEQHHGNFASYEER
jgi:4-hydroxy-tetrahydrodipicolinate synthase